MHTRKQRTLELVSLAIEQARSNEFDAYERTLAEAESELQNAAEVSSYQREILGRLRSCYRRPQSHSARPVTSSTEPLAIVVTPVRNGARFLDETISSVVAQRGAFALRYHVQDGGSTDATVDILKDWEIKLAKRNPLGGAPVRFTWSSEKDHGMYDAISRGFALASHGDAAPSDTLMTWLNADDVLSVNSIWTACCFFKENPSFSWITGMGGLINEAGAGACVFNEPAVFSQLDLALGRHDGRSLCYVQQEGTFWRRTLWDKTGGLARDMKLAGDWDLWRRFACIEPLVKLRTVLALHRRHPTQLSANLPGYHAEIDARSSCAPPIAGVPARGFHAEYDTAVPKWILTEVSTGDVAEKQIRPSSAVAPPKVPPLLPGAKSWPKISIVTPSFNQGRYISETIESVISQGYPNLEYIVVDGGSTDETGAILSERQDAFTHLIIEPDRGQSDALNKGFRLATGEIFCWLNSDDQLAPGALFAVAMAFCTHDVDMVSGICEIYQDGKLCHRHMSSCADGRLPLNDLLDLDTGWNAGQFFYQPEVFFSRALWEKAGSHVREDCYYSMDYELWCRFAFHGARLHVVGSPLARFRQHADQKTADPSKFKAELVTVRDRFAATHGTPVSPGRRPPPRWDRTLRVAVINDIGPLHGAGIAQSRLAAAIEMAGHNIEWFSLADPEHVHSENASSAILHQIAAYGPDVVLFGNLHGKERESVTLLESVSRRYPTFWVLHDFWLLTGRCAYPGACGHYLRGCDESCPTSFEYPALDPARIQRAWTRKRELVAGKHGPIILTNSAWGQRIAADALENMGVDTQTRLAQIRLGAPVRLFRPQSREESRKALGITADSFVIAFSASSLGDERKGGKYLVEALRGIEIPKLSLLVIGNLGEHDLSIEAAEVVSVGYVSNATLLVTALCAADVYVGPSIAETFGQVFIEAALVGLPSVAFDQTGVKDAIREGISGLRVEQSTQALRGAIRRLYDDRQLRADISGWANIYAANEFSLEASYRSLFGVWRTLGLVDKWGLPHKVGFVGPSRFIDETSEAAPTWQPIEGVSPAEGPYPEIPTQFNWCVGEKTVIRINCFEGGLCTLRLKYYSTLFDSLVVTVSNAGELAGNMTMTRTAPGVAAVASLRFTAHAGWNRIELRPDRLRPPSETEARALTFMLKDVDVIRAEAEASRSDHIAGRAA